MGGALLAGDAAHQMPPFMGQGMNSIMRDVINLSLQLPLAISGKSDEALLGNYEAERLSHVAGIVDWSVAIGQLMDHFAEVEAAEREGQTPPETPAERQPSRYGQGREAPPLRGGGIVMEQVSDDGATGYLFSQPLVRDESGREFRLDERLGEGFTIVGRTVGDLAMNDASRAVVSELGIELCTIDGLEELTGHVGRVVGFADTLIVRPDRYVLGHTTDRLSLDQLLEQLRENLHLNLA